MKKLTSLERVAKVLNLQEPDVIPHWELGIARNAIDAILPGASYRDFVEYMDIDGIHPIDPMAGMNLGEAKAKYGNRICLMGNVNCGSTLSWGTIEEVRQEVKDCIRKAGYGGGYICASSNSIHSGVKPENYVAMVKAIREYGRYPLKL